MLTADDSAESTSAHGLGFTEQQLAERARTTLAGAETGVLVLGGSAPPTEVRLFDDGGDVLIVCRALGPVLTAARGRQHAGLLISPPRQSGVRLALHGRLCVGSQQPTPVVDLGRGQTWDLAPALGTDDRLAALRVDRVDIGCPYVGLPIAQDRQVPLGLYAAAEPDLLVAHLPRMLRHLNTHHAEQLRWLAAQHSGVALASIVGATLLSLNPHSATVCWIDETGARDSVVTFPVPARLPAELALLVRAMINAAGLALGVT